jgi:hypothetical protein
MSKLNKRFSAILQKGSGKGSWTYVVWPDSVTFFGTRAGFRSPTRPTRPLSPMLRLSCFFLLGVQTVAHFLAGLEARHSPPVDRYDDAGSWVAGDASRPVSYREYAEAAQLHPVTTGKCRNNLVQYSVDDPFGIARIKMRTHTVKVRAVCQYVLNKLGLDHEGFLATGGCQVRH